MTDTITTLLKAISLAQCDCLAHSDFERKHWCAKSVGEETFEKIKQELIRNDLQILHEKRQRLLDSGLPEERIHYVSHNNFEGPGGTLGVIYSKMEDAVESIESYNRVVVIYDTMSVLGHEPVDCLDFDKIYSLLREAIEDGSGWWDRYKEKMSRRFRK